MAHLGVWRVTVTLAFINSGIRRNKDTSTVAFELFGVPFCLSSFFQIYCIVVLRIYHFVIKLHKKPLLILYRKIELLGGGWCPPWMGTGTSTKT